jgi:pyruvate carboxylase
LAEAREKLNHEWTRIDTGQPLAETRRHLHHEAHEEERRRPRHHALGLGVWDGPTFLVASRFLNHEWTRIHTNVRELCVPDCCEVSYMQSLAEVCSDFLAEKQVLDGL